MTSVDEIIQLRERLRANEADRATLREQLAASQADRAAKAQTIKTLQHMVASLSTTEGALDTLVAIYSRKLGIYHFLKRHEKSLRGLYRALHRRLGAYKRVQPATADTPTRSAASPQTSQGDIASLVDSPLVEAFAAARALGGDTDERVLVDLYELGHKMNQVLCLQPSARNIQALYMLARAGTRVTCVGCRERQTELQSYGFSTSLASLGDWLMTKPQVILAGFDGLLLDARHLANKTLLLFKGRLWPQTRLLIQGLPPEADSIALPWDSPSQSMNGLAIFDSPPITWLDPASRNRSFYDQTAWPWKAETAELPSRLPSGQPWPKITIITVVSDQNTCLEETIRSVLLQGYPDLEYIVLDSDSTGGTSLVLQRYRHEITHLIDESFTGQGEDLKAGFRRATGDIVARLDPNAYLLPGSLLRVALAFDTYGVDIVVGGSVVVGDDRSVSPRVHHNPLPLGQAMSATLAQWLDPNAQQGEDAFYPPELFWSREVWERGGAGIDESLPRGVDHTPWLHMARAGVKLVHIPDGLALFPSPLKNLKHISEQHHAQVKLQTEGSKA